MNFIATVVERVLMAVTWLAMHVVIISERWRRRLPHRIRSWGGSVRRIWRQWMRARGTDPVASKGRYRRRAWNRTPDHVEEQVVRLHVEHPHLGIGALGRLAVRVIGLSAVRETFRRILIRRRDLVIASTNSAGSVRGAFTSASRDASGARTSRSSGCSGSFQCG